MAATDAALILDRRLIETRLLGARLGRPVTPILIQAEPAYAQVLRDAGLVTGDAPDETCGGTPFEVSDHTDEGVALFHDGGAPAADTTTS